MKLSKKQLKKIIAEEIQKVLQEQENWAARELEHIKEAMAQTRQIALYYNDVVKAQKEGKPTEQMQKMLHNGIKNWKLAMSDNVSHHDFKVKELEEIMHIFMKISPQILDDFGLESFLLKIKKRTDSGDIYQDMTRGKIKNWKTRDIYQDMTRGYFDKKKD